MSLFRSSHLEDNPAASARSVPCAPYLPRHAAPCDPPPVTTRCNDCHGAENVFGTARGRDGSGDLPDRWDARLDSQCCFQCRSINSATSSSGSSEWGRASEAVAESERGRTRSPRWYCLVSSCGAWACWHFFFGGKLPGDGTRNMILPITRFTSSCTCPVSVLMIFHMSPKLRAQTLTSEGRVQSVLVCWWVLGVGCWVLGVGRFLFRAQHLIPAVLYFTALTLSWGCADRSAACFANR